MNIKICTYPQPVVSVQHDLEIIKSVLLYADSIELVSPNTSMLALVLSIPYLSEEEKIDFIESIYPAIESDIDNQKAAQQFIDEYRRLLGRKRKVGSELQLFLKIKNGIKTIFEEMATNLENQFSSTGIEELAPIIENGLLTINTIGQEEEDFESDNYIQILADEIKNSISANEAYPLFDDQIGHFAAAMANENKLDISNFEGRRLINTSLTLSIFQDLPFFVNQTIDEILDIREDLNKYLVPFRSAISAYSKQIESLPWDSDFPKECDELITMTIQPAILEIDDYVRSNSYLRNLIKVVTNDALTYGMATGLGFFISKVSELANLSSTFIGLASGTSLTAGKALLAKGERQKEIERNQLFLLYRADQQAQGISL